MSRMPNPGSRLSTPLRILCALLSAIPIAAILTVAVVYAVGLGWRIVYTEGQRSDAHAEINRVVRNIEHWNPDTFRMALGSLSGIEPEQERDAFAAFVAVSQTTSDFHIELRRMNIELPDPSSHAIAYFDWRYKALLGKPADGSEPTQPVRSYTSEWRSAVVTMKRTDEDDPFDIIRIETAIPEIEGSSPAP